MASKAILPEQHKALVFHSIKEPLKVTIQPTPKATSGSAVIRVIATNVMSYTQEICNGTRPYPYPGPFAPGSASVGRVVAVGPDATTLVPGDLVSTDVFVRGRDNPDALGLQGVHQGGTEQSKKLFEGEYKDGTYAEYAKIPLENCLKIPDDGRSPVDWLNLSRMLVAYGGMTDNGGLDLKPGETVVVAPATGQFSGSGVEIALAMGAKVVALGRSLEALQALKTGLATYGDRLKIVQMTGDVEKDTRGIGPVDCYFDISPPAAAKSTHIRSCFQALKPRGRVCLMGGIHDDIAIPHGKIYRLNISIKGKWMYEPNAPGKLLQMVEAGVLDPSRHSSQAFSLDQWNEAFDNAAQNMRWGQLTYLTP